MDKRIEILMNNLPDDMDAALISCGIIPGSPSLIPF